MKKYVTSRLEAINRRIAERVAAEIPLRRRPIHGPFSKERDSFHLTDLLWLRAATTTCEYVESRLIDKPTFGDDLALLTFALGRAPSSGMICEFGVASGRTINHLSSLTDRKVHGFDSFEGLPEDWMDGFEKGRFAGNVPPVNKNVQLWVGLFDQQLPLFVAKESDHIALLHVDCDLYSSTKTIFNQLTSRIVPGTIIVFDEYFNYPGWEKHEHLAFQEYIAASNMSYRYLGYVPSHQQVAVEIVAQQPSTSDRRSLS